MINNSHPPARLPIAVRQRWQPLRGGLLNLYRYDDEQFLYEQGRLLLRGNNGTGKSRVLALQLPFLLDGEVASHRVEPDGDPAKKMEWNLLLGKHNDRLGYTWIEFGCRDEDGTERFLTLGCGLQAAAGRGLVGRWFFVTPQRIGRDLSLTTPAGQALTKDRLIKTIGEAGSVFSTAKDYRQAVDEALFHLGEQRYAGLIDLLIQLRKPQLSRQLDEQKLSSALSEALPPVSPALIADVAESFRGLEADRSALEGYSAAEQAVGGFLETYRGYAQIAARRRAQAVLSAEGGYQTTLEKLQSAQAEFEAAGNELEEIAQRLEHLAVEERAASATMQVLRDSPQVRDAQSLDTARQFAGERAADARQARDDHARALERRREAEAVRQNAVQAADQAAARVAQTMEETGRLARAVGLEDEHRAALADCNRFDCSRFDAHQEQAAAEELRQTEGRLNAAAARLRRGCRHLAQLNGTVRAADEALKAAKEAGAELSGQLDEAIEHRQSVQAALESSAADLLESYQVWSKSVSELTPADADEFAEPLEQWCATGRGRGPIEQAVGRLVQEALERLSARRAECDQKLTAARAERSRLAEASARLEAGVHDAPPAPYTRDAGSREHRPGGPLWAVCDFRSGIDETIRAGLEAALEASGLLDAWVTPEGRLLEAGVHDTLLTALESDAPAFPVERSLAAVLTPAVDGGHPQTSAVSEATVAALLRQIGFVSSMNSTPKNASPSVADAASIRDAVDVADGSDGSKSDSIHSGADAGSVGHEVDADAGSVGHDSGDGSNSHSTYRDGPSSVADAASIRDAVDVADGSDGSKSDSIHSGADAGSVGHEEDTDAGSVGHDFGQVANLSYWEGDAQGVGSIWVAADGRWRVGPLRGAWTKPAVQYLGQAAREAGRKRQRHALAQQTAEVEQKIASLQAQIAALEEQRRLVHLEAAEAPDENAVRRALAQGEVAAEAVSALQERLNRADARIAQRRRELTEALERRHRDAIDLGLAERVERLHDFEDALSAYERALAGLWPAVREQRAAKRQTAEAEQRFHQARDEEQTRAGLLHEADKRVQAAQAEYQTLHESVGEAVDRILAKLDEARRQAEQIRQDRQQAAAREKQLAVEAALAKKEFETQTQWLSQHQRAREAAVDSLRKFAQTGLLAAALLDRNAEQTVGRTILDQAGDGRREAEGTVGPTAAADGIDDRESTVGRTTLSDEIEDHSQIDHHGQDCPSYETDAAAIGRWSAERIADFARSIEARLQQVDTGEAAWDRSQKGVHRGIQELTDALLPHGYEPNASLEGGVFLVSVPFQGRNCAPAELYAALQEEVAARRSLLDNREREVLENHLIGEAAVHLHQRLRDGERLVEEMNEELRERPMSTGMALRFKWRPIEHGPRGLIEARKRLFQGGGRWSPEDRQRLGDFLQRQIQAQRAENETGTWLDHLTAALDYRTWHEFSIERRQDGHWKRLTRRTHGTGSGGEKAIALTLPQFAAAAAHYRTADARAPRLILLDEAFVGVDADMRSKCMGLLTAFDLDFMMTSEREWGCYATLPGLAIYQLSARPGIDAVGVTRWVWNGRQRTRDLPPAGASQ